jgi:hypothetical protein
MTLRRFARRWAVAGVLAALGMYGEGVAQAQHVTLVSATDSAGQPQAVPQVIQAAPVAPAPTVVSGEPVLVPNAGQELAPGTAAAPAPCADGGFNWSKVPVVPFVLPRPGYFIIPPAGPGYYTGLDWLLGNYREKPPAYPYPRNSINIYRFYDFSFAYLDNPNNTEHDYLDPLKRIHLGDNWLLSFGGEFRYRNLKETDYAGNARGTNAYLEQYRTRLYADLWYRDLFRIYAETIDARTDHFRRPLNIGPFDTNHLDLLNAFIDVKIPFLDEGTDRASYVRVGRQELLFGSQRLVSPVEFSNTRGNNFQGVYGFSHGKQFDFDAFVVNPIVHDPFHFDSIADKQLFLGSWLTYRPVKGQSAELYYLNLSNANQTFVGNRGVRGGMDVNTFGTRYSGAYNNFLFDFEGMYQFGTYSNKSSSAGATVAEVGYQFKDVAMNPQVWIGYDWASGGNQRAGTRHTFNQLFTFGHYYLGQADIVGRQNINDVSAQFCFFPTNWIQAGMQYHMFYLDDSHDSLYNKAGVATRSSPTGAAGTNVGRELDFLVNFHLTNHSDIQFAYSHFFSGSFMERTGSGKDIDYGYLQYTFRF